MSAPRLVRIVLATCFGSIATSLVLHANHIHYRDQAWAMSLGVFLAWFAFALAVSRAD